MSGEAYFFVMSWWFGFSESRIAKVVKKLVNMEEDKVIILFHTLCTNHRHHHHHHHHDDDNNNFNVNFLGLGH
jgi:hypothetical protein